MRTAGTSSASKCLTSRPKPGSRSRNGKWPRDDTGPKTRPRSLSRSHGFLKCFFLNCSFCAVPVNQTALLIIGGYSNNGALSSVELLDTVSGRWETYPDLPRARYGHSCLMMEWVGKEGILVSGGALTGNQVDFLNLKTKRFRDTYCFFLQEP